MTASQEIVISGPRRGPRVKGPALKGIVPASGGTTTLGFGAKSGRKKTQKKNPGPIRRFAQDCWNAFSPSHLPLPRAVGEYTVTRGTRQISTTDKLIIVGTFQYSYDDSVESRGYGRNWSDVVALGCTDLTKTPSEVAWRTYKMPMLTEGLGDHSQITPSACSVQVMNGNALQTTSGMLYIGKMKVQPTYAADEAETGADIASNFVSYMAPRLCAAAKLALRGVHIDAHPLNMNRLADFTEIYKNFPGSTSTPGVTTWTAGLSPTGFSPIMIYNPDGVELNLLVCHEYRTRFELYNPAVASHKYHPPARDTDWAGMIKNAAAIGSGVMDIVDVVARTGLLKTIPKIV